MEQLFFVGKAYLKINSLAKTPLHEFRVVEGSGLWAPGFSVPSIILADLLGNTCLLARVQKVMVCDLWLVDFDQPSWTRITL